MSLIDKTYLCYINIELLERLIREKSSFAPNFAREKEKWKKEINFQPIFFTDTELLLINGEVILLKVFDDNHANFLAKTYQLEYQTICQKIFQEKKNIILVTENQWKAINNISKGEGGKKAIVLFKDEENIKESLINWTKINIR